MPDYDYGKETGWPTPRNLDIVIILCPSLKTITIGSTIGVLLTSRTCWCAVQKSQPAWHTTCALSRFHNLQYVTIHVEVDESRLRYLDPVVGRKATNDVYHLVQERKCGRPLQRLTLVLTTPASNLFGHARFQSETERVTVTFETGGGCKTSGELSSTCSDPSLGDLLMSRKQAAERAGLDAWKRHIGPYLWERRQGQRPLPKLRQVEWLIHMALPPSIFNRDGHMDYLPATSADTKWPSSYWRSPSGFIKRTASCPCQRENRYSWRVERHLAACHCQKYLSSKQSENQ